MITHKELQELASERPEHEPGVLTAYVHVDQGYAANLNHGYETALRDATRTCRQALADAGRPLDGFDEAHRRLAGFLREYEPAGKGLALFIYPKSGRLDAHRLDVPVETRVYWRGMPYVRPLAEACDEYERYAVILAGREQARLFLMALGQIEEEREAFAEMDTHQFDASGKDKWMSQMPFQHKQEEHYRHHLRDIVDRMATRAETGQFTRLIVAGPEPVPQELHDQLTPALKDRFIGTLSLPVEAPENRVLEATGELVAVWERRDEANLVDQVITAAAKDARGVVTPESTIDACFEKRVHRLLYADGFKLDEPRAAKLRTHVEQLSEMAADSPAAGIPTDDMLEWMVQMALRQGAHIEQVREEPAQRLMQEAEGIGALLRF